ncbi:peptidase inhibitor family I36 protein [Streptomyces sp. NPDC097619]|uniref:peptidase inhibitor family I36 protein n=1 Tax=Streptomyces sp. NPDC097619 TaxID=3157228 RepID=UPI003318CC84
MKINTRGGGALIAGAVVLFATLFGALPANAAGYDCGTHTLCLYSTEDGTGTGAQVQSYARDGNPSTGVLGNEDAQSYEEWNDQARSFHNRTLYWACFYVETSYGGAVVPVKPRAKGTLAALAPGLGGKLSSHKLVPSQGQCFTGFERCQDDKLCLFYEPNGRGRITQLDKDYTTYHPDHWANRVQAVYNRTATSACFYAKPAAERLPTDKPFRVLPGDATTVAAPYAKTFNSHTLKDNGECK